MATSENRVQLCGSLVVRLDGRALEPEIRGPQSHALLGFLVLHRNRHVMREELVEALWPEGAPAAADQALRTLLSRLRGALGDGRLIGKSELRLVLPAGTWVDVEAAEAAIHEAESAVAQRKWERAWATAHIALNVGARVLLPRIDAPWVSERRRGLEEVRLRALEALAASGLALGGPELDTAARAARRLIELAPYRESGHRHLMAVLAAEGNVAEALLVYDALRCRLRDDLGVAPSRPLQELHRTLVGA